MAIKEVITLEGVEQVEAGLARVNKAGEDSLKSFRDLGSQATGGGFDKLVEGAKRAGLELENTSESTLKFNTVLRALKPLLNDIGLGIGQFGSVARLASQSLTAFGALAAGAAVVSLGKLEENLARMRGELEDAFRSPGAGQQAFAALNRQAQQFGSSVGDLLPGLLAFQQALSNVDRTAKGFVALKAEDLPLALAPPKVEAVTEAYENFIKILRAGRLTQDEAEKSATAFFNSFKQGGQATKAALQALPIETLNQLKQALGAAGQSNAEFFAAVESGALSIDRLQKALAGFGPQAQRAFDTKAIKTMGETVGRILAELNAGFAELSGKPFSDFVIAELARIRKGIRDTIDEYNRLKDLIGRGEEAIGAKAGSDLMGKIVQQVRNITGIGADIIPLPRPRPPEADTQAATQRISTQTSALNQNTAAKRENAAAADQLAAATKQTIGLFEDDVEKIIAQTNALHDALIEQRQQAAPAIGGIVAIPGAQAEQAGKNAADAFRKGWISAPVVKIEDIVQITPEKITPTATEAGNAAVTGFGKAFVDGTAPIAQTAISTINEKFTEQTIAVPPFSVEDAFASMQKLFNDIIVLFSTPIKVQLKGEFTGPLGTFTGGGPGEFLAGGGKVRGRGTSTSDSNFAWLSTNEWVINARAVQHYGSALFSALNAMTLPRDFVSRFAMGGLVRAMNNGNRMAGGGQVSASPGTPLILDFGGRSFETHASDQTVKRLRRFAVSAQIASIGRKPGFVR